MAVVSQVITPEVLTTRRPTGALLRSSLRLRRTQIGLGLVLFILAIAIIGPHVAPHSGSDFVGTPNSTSVPGALFGTDHIGQDVWSRFLHGGRVTRGASRPVVERDFVAAAEAIGVPRFQILLSEIFPNILSPLLVEASLRLTYAIGLIAALAFLGFTTNPGAADWGLMIQEN